MEDRIEGFENYKNESVLLPNAAEDSEDSKSLTDLFTSEFMKLYTQFDSIEEFFSSGGFEINSEDDFEAIADTEIDAHVMETTNFTSWKEMLTEAVDEYTIEKSGH